MFDSIDGSLSKRPEVKIDPSKIEFSSTGQLKLKQMTLLENLKLEVDLFIPKKDHKLFLTIATPLLPKIKRLGYEKACVETVQGKSVWFSLHFAGDITIYFEVYIKPGRGCSRDRAFFTIWKGKGHGQSAVMLTNGYGGIKDCLSDIRANLKRLKCSL